MKFLICPASEDQLQDTTDMFLGTDGYAYNYQVEYFPGDMVSIEDTVGRIMPLDIEELSGLINILTRINKFENATMYSNFLNMSDLLNGVSLPKST